MADIEKRIRGVLDASGLAYEIMPCHPDLADTMVFCAHYGVLPEVSANLILVKTKRRNSPPASSWPPPGST